MKIMSQSPKPLDPFVFSFSLNPNLSTHLPSGFKRCLENPIELQEPQPEFALTVPGELVPLTYPTDKKEWH